MPLHKGMKVNLENKKVTEDNGWQKLQENMWVNLFWTSEYRAMQLIIMK